MFEVEFCSDCVVSHVENRPVGVNVVGVVVVVIVAVGLVRIPMTYRDPWRNRAEVKEVEVGVVIQSESMVVRVVRVDIMMSSNSSLREG